MGCRQSSSRLYIPIYVPGEGVWKLTFLFGKVQGRDCRVIGTADQHFPVAVCLHFGLGKARGIRIYVTRSCGIIPPEGKADLGHRAKTVKGWKESLWCVTASEDGVPLSKA